MKSKSIKNELSNVSSFGKTETTYLPRISWIFIHLGLVLIAAWLYFGQGYEQLGNWFGANWQPGDQGRRVLLLLCGVLLWLRMSFMILYLLKRKFGWAEVVPVTGAAALYQLGFAFLGAGQSAALGWLDVLGVGLVLAGSYINTGSELERKKFKENPGHKGQLYTGGLFRYSQHPNYLGDVVWATGWAILTHCWWAIIIPILLGLSFIFFLIPALNSYLHEHYQDQFEEWSKTTRKLIPFIY